LELNTQLAGGQIFGGIRPRKDKDQGRKLPTIEVEVVEEVPK
jgi:hypothetical protein